MSGQVKVGDPATHWGDGPCCSATYPGPGAYGCTEPRGHTGDHVACGFSEVCAVWPNEVKSVMKRGRDVVVGDVLDYPGLAITVVAFEDCNSPWLGPARIAHGACGSSVTVIDDYPMRVLVAAGGAS